MVSNEDEELLRAQLEGEELERKKRELNPIEDCELDNRGVPIRKDDDGTVYEWDESMKGWFPKVDAAFLAAYRLSYGEDTSEKSVPALSDNSVSTESQAPSKDNVRYCDPVSRKMYAWNSEKFLWVNEKDPLDTMVPDTERLSNDTLASKPAGYIWSEKYQQWVAEKYVDPTTKTEYVWNAQKSQYLPPGGLDDDDDENEEESPGLAAEDQDDNTFTDSKKEENTTTIAPGSTVPSRKRKEVSWFNMEDDQNSNVYVYNLPLDTTPTEFEELMNKYGIIMCDPDTGKPKIKLYSNPDGTLKGDGRCCYLKKESVDLCLKILDGLDYRDGKKIGVQKAQFQLKGEFDPSLKKKKRGKKKKAGKGQEKLLDWRPESNRMVASRKRCEKVVVLKNVFDARNLNLRRVPEIQKNVTQACARFGALKKVCVFDLHDDGVVSVAFRDWDSADLCVSQLHNRQFLGRQVTAEIWDGVTNYKIIESEEQEQARIERWEKELSETKEEAAPKKTKTVLDDVVSAGGDLHFMDDEEQDEEKMKELMADLASGGESFGSVKSVQHSHSDNK